MAKFSIGGGSEAVDPRLPTVGMVKMKRARDVVAHGHCQEPSGAGFDYDAKPQAMAANCDGGPQLTERRASADDVAAFKAKQKEQHHVALPTPIATLVVDGRHEPIYKPIPGFEHVFQQQASSRVPEPSDRVVYKSSRSSQGETRRPGISQQHSQQQPQPHPHPSSKLPASAQRKRTAEGSRRSSKKPPKKPAVRRTKTLKRTRPTLERNSYDSAQDDEDEAGDHDVRIKKETSFTLYIGNIEDYKHFLRTRFLELTLKPLRGIVTEWIKELEPNRLSMYGPYTKDFPNDKDKKSRAPPWWPRHIIYNEPSHLKKDALIPLAIEIMLLHRNVDERKRGNHSWIERLKMRAMYQVSMTPAEQFSSSDSPGHSEQMRDRALNNLLPNLFDVARSHEDHLEMYGLYEGLEAKDPGCGKYVQWQRIPMPPRPHSQRKRSRPNDASRTLRHEPDAEDSDDDTEVDEDMNNVNSCNESFHSSFTADDNSIRASPTFSPSESHPTATQQVPPEAPPAFVSHHPNFSSHGSISPPTSSFDQSLNQLRLDEAEECDAKVGSTFHAPQFSPMHQNYNPFHYQPMEAPPPAYSGQDPYGPVPGFAEPNRFTVFSSYHQHMANPTYTAMIAPPNLDPTGGYHYGFDNRPPQAYQTIAPLPNMSVPASDAKPVLNTLASEYDPERHAQLHHH